MVTIRPSKATNQTITCSSSGCSGISGALFDESNIVPFFTITRSVLAINNYDEARQFEVQILDDTFVDELPKMSEVITVEIVPDGSTTPIYGPVTIDQWRKAGLVTLGTIPHNGSQKYQFIARMADVGNEFQNKKMQFDLNVGFETASVPQTASENPGVGGVSSSNPSAPVCSAKSPGSAPVISAINAGANAILLRWDSVDPSTHYMIQYGTGNTWLYGNPNVGSTSSYVVGSLSGNIQYNFRVAAVNDCAPGPWSTSTSLQATGEIIATQEIAPGFQQILGVQSEASSSDQIKMNPSVLGSTLNCEKSFHWWLPLFFQAILQFAFQSIVHNRHRRMTLFLLTSLLFLASQYVHSIFGCQCNENSLCEWYLVFNIILSLFGSLLSLKFFSAGKKQRT